jgi:hypothetical protein
MKIVVESGNKDNTGGNDSLEIGSLMLAPVGFQAQKNILSNKNLY